MSKQDKWTASFQQASETVSKWREKHPRATFTDIENRVDEQLARVRATMIQDLALESELTRPHDNWHQKRARSVQECGRPLERPTGKQTRQLITNHEQKRETGAQQRILSSLSHQLFSPWMKNCNCCQGRIHAAATRGDDAVGE
jgi:hypothetical protein